MRRLSRFEHTVAAILLTPMNAVPKMGTNPAYELVNSLLCIRSMEHTKDTIFCTPPGRCISLVRQLRGNNNLTRISRDRRTRKSHWG